MAQFPGDQLLGDQLLGDQLLGDQLSGVHWTGVHFTGSSFTGGEAGNFHSSLFDQTISLDQIYMSLLGNIDVAAGLMAFIFLVLSIVEMVRLNSSKSQGIGGLAQIKRSLLNQHVVRRAV